MANLREEISRTFTRITGLGDSRSRATTKAPDTRAGRQFGAYRIIRQLGAGGMGHVYLALDTRLGRHVALKFLPPDLISDQVSLLRLVQEAKAASALNHPNILTIYDVGELDGEPFIVSEFVDGVTLRTALERDAVTAELAVEITRQVASALSAAHAAGVIHRDLKPTNVMLRPDGYVKVIDFGLAKRLVNPESPAEQQELTRPGTTLGTAEYMSPEQARGEEVNYRTDIWSLGVILYEMIAGRRPFDGPTVSHVLVAIQDNPVSPFPVEDPALAALYDVVLRALEKNPNNRYESAGEMLQALEALRGVPQSSSRIRLAERRVGRRPRKFVFIGILLCLLAAAGAFAWWRSHQAQWLHIEPFRQLTFNGRTRLAVLSPDGKYLAYTVGQPDGQQALYLKQIDSPADELKIPPRKINYHGLTFSPDNQTLYVVEKDEALVGRLYALPLLGARPTNPIIFDIDGPVSFSPAGDQFVYVRHKQIKGTSGNSTLSLLMLANHDGQNIRPLLSTSDVLIFRQPAWSPDGKRIAVFVFRERPHSSGEAFLDLVKLDGSESRRLMPDWQAIGQPRWTADSKSLIVGVRTYSQPNLRDQLHQLAIYSGADHLLTNDLAAYKEASLSAESRQATAIKTDSKAVVWISRPNDFAHGDTVPADAERYPSMAWSDAVHLVVDSRRNGFPNLALLDTQTQSFDTLTNEKFVEQGVAAIPRPGGKSLVFASNRSGEFHIWRFDADSNRLRQLTFGENYDEHPSASPDGRWIVYTSWSQSVTHLRKVPVDGGPSVQIGSYNAEDPQVSPDGKSIACYIRDPTTGKWTAAIVPFDGSGEPRPLPGVSTPLSWSPDGASIVTALTDPHGVSNVWRVPLRGGDPVQLTQFEDQSILALAVSPSGDRVACLRAISGADVALFKMAN
jgi:serine/threonine protein kinase